MTQASVPWQWGAGRLLTVTSKVVPAAAAAPAGTRQSARRPAGPGQHEPRPSLPGPMPGPASEPHTPSQRWHWPHSGWQPRPGLPEHVSIPTESEPDSEFELQGTHWQGEARLAWPAG